MCMQTTVCRENVIGRRTCRCRRRSSTETTLYGRVSGESPNRYRASTVATSKSCTSFETRVALVGSSAITAVAKRKRTRLPRRIPRPPVGGNEDTTHRGIEYSKHGYRVPQNFGGQRPTDVVGPRPPSTAPEPGMQTSGYPKALSAERDSSSGQVTVSRARTLSDSILCVSITVGGR